MLTKNLVVFASASTEKEAIQALSIVQALSVSAIPMLIAVPAGIKRSISSAVGRFGGLIISTEDDPLCVAERNWPERHLLLLPACTTEISLHGINLAMELLDQSPDIKGVSGILGRSKEWTSDALCWPNYKLPNQTKLALPAEATDRHWYPAGAHSYMFVDAPGPFLILSPSKFSNLSLTGSPWLRNSAEILISQFEDHRKFILFTGMQAVVECDQNLSHFTLAEGDVCDLSHQSHICLHKMGVDQVVIPGLARIYFDNENNVSFLTREKSVGVFGQTDDREIGVESFYDSAITSHIVGTLLESVAKEKAESEKEALLKRLARWKKRAQTLIYLLALFGLILLLLISWMLL